MNFSMTSYCFVYQLQRCCCHFWLPIRVIMAPFWYTDLFKPLKTLMNIFVKSAVMKRISSTLNLTTDEYSKVGNWIHNQKCCKWCYGNPQSHRLAYSWLSYIVQKLVEDNLLKLLRKTVIQCRLERDLIRSGMPTSTQCGRHRVKPTTCEVSSVPSFVVRQNTRKWSWWHTQDRDYSCEVVGKQLSTFTDFDPAQSSLDSIMFHIFPATVAFSKLWNIDRMLLLLSHDQTTVERDRQTEADNLDKQSFVAWHIVCDYVQFVDGIDKVDVSNNQLLISY